MKLVHLVLVGIALMQATTALHAANVELAVRHSKKMTQVVRDHPMSPAKKGL